MLAYTLARVIFILINPSILIDASIFEILNAFWLGLRFDLSTVLSINLLFIIISLIPYQPFLESKSYKLLLKRLLVFGNLPFLLLDLFDSELFAYTGRRSNASGLVLLKEVYRMIYQLAVAYWYVALIIVLFGYMFWLIYPKNSVPNKYLKLKIAIPLHLFFVALSILGIRGGIQIKPLMPGHAFTLQPSKLGNIALNTPFVIFKTLSLENLYPRVNFMPDEKALIISTQISFGLGSSQYKNQNICILILESFSPEYIGYANNGKGYTPFLDSLCEKSIYFPNAFANGTRSIEALPSITAALPNLFEESFISSQYTQNMVIGLPEVLKTNGYSSAFLHGGNNGTMGFDYFAGMAGFQKYYGRIEYGLLNDYDGNWGIFDEPFLQYSVKKMTELKPPFLSTIFTLSSHQPFTIPEKYKNSFPEGTMPIHKSIGYADYSLKQFFAAAQKEKWYANTLFILTADHTTISDNPKYASEPEKFRIPIIFYHPSNKLPKTDTQKIIQHADIMPTIIDYCGIQPKERMKIGRSIFATGDNPTAQMLNGHYYSFTKTGYCTLTDAGKEEFFNLAEPQKTTSITNLKAQVQYFNHGMLDNNWYK
jgi:uncharacterized sulfatase